MNSHENQDIVRYFCPRCFADDRGGSWGAGVDPQGRLCANCGGMDFVKMPEWAVDSIRKQASWIGKRYYPSSEDREARLELRFLRLIAPMPDGEAHPIRDDGESEVSRWWVTQGRHSTVIEAQSEAEARELAKLVLPYPVGGEG